MMVKKMYTSREVGRDSPKIMICTKAGSCCLTITAVLQSLMSKSLIAPNARRSMALPRSEDARTLELPLCM
jgi:hypothetical protein